MNKFLGIGRLVANPTFFITQNNVKVTRFRVAIKNGKKFEPLFINVATFDNLAEYCQKMLQKGSKIFIEGRVEHYQTEDKKDYYGIIATNIQFLDKLKSIPKEAENDE